jgi:uncharacterized membrane protein
MYIKIKLLGHSFHPMLVAYPVVLYTATLVAFLVYQLQAEQFWFRLGHVANKVGVMMALVTLLPGLVSWALRMPRGATIRSSDLWYLMLNVGGLALFSVTALLNAGKWDQNRPEIGLALILSAIGVGLTIAAGFYGWTFVQNQNADDASVWQWQVRAARLAEELEQTRTQLATVRDELRQLKAEPATQDHAPTQPERVPTWTAMATQTWSAMADQAWLPTPETHSNPAKLVLAVVVTVGAVAILSLVPNVVGLR